MNESNSVKLQYEHGLERGLPDQNHLGGNSRLRSEIADGSRPVPRFTSPGKCRTALSRWLKVIPNQLDCDPPHRREYSRKAAVREAFGAIQTFAVNAFGPWASDGTAEPGTDGACGLDDLRQRPVSK